MWRSKPDEQHLKHLRDAGLVADLAEAEALSWETVKQFNVAVLYDLPHHDKGGAWPQTFDHVPPLLVKFVEAGGGLLSAGLCASHGQTIVHNELLKHFGIQAPYERIVEADPGKRHTMTAMFGHRFALTREVAQDHPATEGVETLWYYFPRDGATLGEFPHPLVPGSEAWRVLVWGSTTARSARMPNFGEQTDESIESAVTYRARPPLLAARQMGKGRVVVSVMNQSHLIYNGWHFAYDGIAMAKGDGQTPSHWERLFVNLYRWLAEPSLEADQPGGFQPDRDAETKAEAQYQAELRVGFDRTDFGPPTGKHFKGLIGARTAYSVGRGGVAHYVTSARKAGYSWIVFAERYEEMTEGRWHELAADCEKATRLAERDDDFWAIPGLEYPDQCGNRFISFGPVMGWLKEEWLKTKRFGANEDVNVNYKFPDTILFELARNRLDPHYIGHYYSIAIETYRGPDQRVTSNDLAQYARMQYLRYNLHPSAIHFVDDPTHVGRAATTGLQNFIHETSLGKILSRISGHTARYCHVNHPVPMYVSEGPRIAAWQGSRTGLGARDRFLGGEPIQHWEARLAVESDQPIKEVRFSNGPHLMRRHLPSHNTFDHVYHGFHERQHNLFASIVDAAGRRAVTSCLITLTLRNMLVNCTDNRNIILGGQYGHSRKPPRGFEMYFKKVAWGCLPPAPILLRTRAKLQALNPIDDRHEYFASKDMVILDQPLRSTWPVGLVAHGAKVNGYPEADDLPVQDYDYAARTYRLTTGKDNPELLLVEGDLRFKRDLSFSDETGLDVTVARLWSGRSVPSDFQAIVVGDTKAMEIRRRVASRLVWSGEVEPGQYLAAAPGLTGAGAIFPLDGPFQWWGQVTDKRIDIHAGLDLPPKVEAGHRVTTRFLYAAGRFGEPVDSRQFVDVIEQLGLAGEVPYTVTPDTGEVLDTKLLLTVKASDGAFSAKITKAPLPVDGLTVKVMGVNNNWSAGIWGRDNRILSRAGGRDGVVWANIDISRDRDVFIGNLIFCDQPNLVLTFLEGNQERSVFQAHNPTDEAIIATVRSHPRFDRTRPIRRDMRVSAGTTVEVVCE